MIGAGGRDVGTGCLEAGTAFGTPGRRRRSVPFRELGLEIGVWPWLEDSEEGEEWPKSLAKMGGGRAQGPRDGMGWRRGGEVRRGQAGGGVLGRGGPGGRSQGGGWVWSRDGR